MEQNSLAIFENFKIRRHYDEKSETWFFSVIDIVAVLIEQTDFKKARKYWNKLSERLKKEGSEVVTNCHQLKMVAQDGKMRETDVANVEVLLRIIQTVPSKKAEPVKLWLAKVGYERMQEMADPEQALNRSRDYWRKLGRSEKWIQQRMMGQEIRNKLTDYWGDHGVKKGDEFAILTNIIHEEWTELSVKSHKELKGLKKQSSDLEDCDKGGCLGEFARDERECRFGDWFGSPNFCRVACKFVLDRHSNLTNLFNKLTFGDLSPVIFEFN